jgi:hypothetical protein
MHTTECGYDDSDLHSPVVPTVFFSWTSKGQILDLQCDMELFLLIIFYWILANSMLFYFVCIQVLTL